MSDTEPIIRKTFNISFIKENIVKIKQVINEMKNSGNNNILEHELEIITRFSKL